MKKIILLIVIIISPIFSVQNIAENKKDRHDCTKDGYRILGASKIASEKEVLTRLRE